MPVVVYAYRLRHGIADYVITSMVTQLPSANYFAKLRRGLPSAFFALISGIFFLFRKFFPLCRFALAQTRPMPRDVMIACS